jgi:HEAT repeat protein
LLKDRAITDNHEDVRRAAVEALVSNFKDDPDTLRLLKDRATRCNDRYVRRAAVEALVSNSKMTPTLCFAQRPGGREMGMCDVQRQALVSNFKDEPGILNVFYN